ncbi:MAG: hypothetical protein JXQ93_12430 [Flavobacteriaceae bacterium]
MLTLKFIIHYGLHYIFPLVLALVFYKNDWRKVYFIFLATMLIDLDHLLAVPVYDATRCSINFHPLHTYYAFIIYIGFLFFKKTRIVGIGIILHLITDQIDCFF